ncbi:mRNA-binding ribosome synthesis protein nop7, partial [Nowakowskiella sp. JEL0078]
PTGGSNVYITRNLAIKKLQISLAQFRRLCILKGIYPREPKNKKKANNGSTAPKTYYFRKDIQYLFHEPILGKFREQSAHAKKINKAFGKHELVVAKKLMQNKPGYSLDHIIKERYPSFVDALRDLDDVLSLVFLFASLPADQRRVHTTNTNTCKRLAAEFQRYIGIYYQVEIRGQKITWIVPYQFSQILPNDVDFKVMGTFLELYQTHLGFVNFKLYSDAGLSYPPKIDLEKDSGSAGLNCFTLESKDGQVFTDPATNRSETTLAKSLSDAERNEMEKRVQSLKNKLATIAEHDANESAKNQDTKLSNSITFENSSNSQDATRINDVTTLDELVATKESTSRQNLFSKCVFWLSREVPRWSLEFVIRSCGGVCGWDISSGVGSPFAEDSPRITHHIVDRPVNKKGKSKNHERREYIQPQWIYDCVNVGKLLSAKGYHQGETLPPHLSPFVSLEDGDYVPEEAYKLLKRQEDDFAEEVAEEEEEIVKTDITKKENKESQVKRKRNIDDAFKNQITDNTEIKTTKLKTDNTEVKGRQVRNKRKSPVEDAAHHEELEAEAAGISFSEFEQKKTTPKKTGEKRLTNDDEADMKQMAAMMLSKKKRKLYNSVVNWKNKKDEKADKLRAKKEDIKKKSKNSK